MRFKRDVEVAFLSRADLGAYVRELFDDEYPPARPAPTSACSPRSTSCRRHRPARAAREGARGERGGLLRRAAGEAAALRGERRPAVHRHEPDRPRPRAAPRPPGPVRGAPRRAAGLHRRLRRPARRLPLAARGRRHARDGAVRAPAARGARLRRRARGRRRRRRTAPPSRPPGSPTCPALRRSCATSSCSPTSPAVVRARAVGARRSRGGARRVGAAARVDGAGAAPRAVLRGRGAARGVARGDGSRRRDASSRRASSASCLSGRCSATAARRRPRAGAGTAGGCGTWAAGRSSRGAASGTPRRTATRRGRPYAPASRASTAPPSHAAGGTSSRPPGRRAFALRREGTAAIRSSPPTTGRSSTGSSPRSRVPPGPSKARGQ